MGVPCLTVQFWLSTMELGLKSPDTVAHGLTRSGSTHPLPVIPADSNPWGLRQLILARVHRGKLKPGFRPGEGNDGGFSSSDRGWPDPDQEANHVGCLCCWGTSPKEDSP